MKIHGSHDPTQQKLHALAETQANGRKASSSAASRGSETSESTGHGHVAAPERAQLADQLRSTTESREDLVKNAARRLANGEFGTREVAERVADRIADSPFGGFIRGI